MSLPQFDIGPMQLFYISAVVSAVLFVEAAYIFQFGQLIARRRVVRGQTFQVKA